MDRESIAWAAGLFEGEGCISLTNGQTGNHRYRYPRVEMNSTDLDVLHRFLDVVGIGNVRGPVNDKRCVHYKPQWSWSAGGFEQAQAVVAMFWPWLCSRRRARAREVLTHRPVGRQVR